MGNVESRNCYSLDLVRSFGDRSFDRFFVGFSEDGGHVGWISEGVSWVGILAHKNVADDR